MNHPLTRVDLWWEPYNLTVVEPMEEDDEEEDESEFEDDDYDDDDDDDDDPDDERCMCGNRLDPTLPCICPWLNQNQ